MTIKDFETRLQTELDETITIVPNPNAPDIAGVYWGSHYLGVAVPPKNIEEKQNLAFQDAMGFPYKTIDQAFELTEAKLAKFKRILKEDPELLTDATD